MTFAQFMETALYFDDGGYYTGDEERWGPEGDYITNLDVTPVFARIVAKQIREMWQRMGSPDAFSVYEIGAGRGLLSSGIADWAKENDQAFYEALYLALIEKNPFLRIEGEKFRYLDDLSSLKASMDAPVRGVFLTNELLDALPVHMVAMERGVLKEIYVGLEKDKDGDGFVEIRGDLSDPAIGGYFDSLGIRLEEGGRAELSLKARGWIEEVAELLECGYVLNVDYGLPARELYVPGRNGTLRCLYRHTKCDDPYIRVGEQDMTAHVDFTTVARAGIDAGLKLEGFTTQFYFLMGLDVGSELIEVTDPGKGDLDAIVHNRAVKELLMPGGMGSVFKVLIHSKAINDKGTPLMGLSFKDLSAALCIDG